MSFDDIASQLMGWNAELKSTERRFRSTFGVCGNMCNEIWFLLEKSGWTDYAGQNPKKIHLLWALLFMKGYSTTEVSAVTMRVDEKTFRQWSWFYIEGVANLDKFVV